ncbi:sigma-E factor negative regulatory protein [Oleiagrimonas soli]|uniref:Sigma-E factor negative regulatory protein RseA n=1 Tax=Oleiagrimonas soli TaxID=1543381 RepID=A0A841KLZ9_9GAMM|nr:sigma-E factor negative regulatory protein [Oleiagrimonas soli]MBB6183088.1 sigma-E factor negative regulatory protein RseA [Oleiagrimonas soli]
MNEAHRENLSAFTDGELEFEQVRFLLRRVEHDAELRASWTHYHVGRECLRREFAGAARADFADRVMAALDAAPADVAVGHGSRRWLRWSAGGAIAASVAAVALMVAQPTAPTSDAAGNSPTIAAASTSAEDTTNTIARAPEVPRWLSVTPMAGQLSQRASASTLDGQLRGDTLTPATYQLSGDALIPTTYAQHVVPYMSTRGYPAREAANARQYGRTDVGGWVMPTTPDSQAPVQTH